MKRHGGAREPTVNTSRFIAVIRTVVDFVALLGAVDAGTITTLEFIRTTRQQSCRRHTERKMGKLEV